MEKRLTPSLVISVIALIVALGGVGYAAVKIPKNSVGTKQLKKKAVSTAKLKKGAVTTARLKKNAVSTGKIKKNAVNSARLKDWAVTDAKLKPDSVNSSKVADASLLRGDFAQGQINGDAWIGQRDTTTLLDLTGTAQDVAVTPVLPAGSYVLAGRANILGGPTGSRLICSLEADAAQNVTVAPSGMLPLSMSSVAVLTEPGPITLSCSKSSGTPRVAQAHVIATSVNSVSGLPPE